MPTPEWFWPKVDKSGPGGCWIWTGTRNHYGRGVIELSKTIAGEKHQKQAHRFAYEFARGPITGGLYCLHKCGNGHLACVNPDHLYLGTQVENGRDRVEHARLRKLQAVAA